MAGSYEVQQSVQPDVHAAASRQRGRGLTPALGATRMTYTEFELFLQPSPSFLEGEQKLVEGGPASVGKLTDFFTGEAKNEFGVEYRKLGQAMICALETAKRLGSVAKSLEPYLREQVLAGKHTAAMALAALGTLEEASVQVLATAMGAPNLDLAAESAAALLACGQSSHPAFVTAMSALPHNSPLYRIVKELQAQ